MQIIFVGEYLFGHSIRDFLKHFEVILPSFMQFSSASKSIRAINSKDDSLSML